MSKLYNTQENIASDLGKFFEKVTNVTKPQLKLIPYLILGMVESESIVTADIVKKLKGNFLKVKPSSTTRKVERFFNNEKFDVYKFYDGIIKNVIANYKISRKEIHVTMDHMFCRNNFTILLFSMRIGKQRNTIMV